MRRLTTIALLAGLLIPAGSARAASAAGVKVASCDSTARKATFTGHMRTVAGARELGMRFAVLERYGDQPFARVPAPDLHVWRKSEQGVKSYTYDQTLTGLEPGGVYRVRVAFRWYDAAGRVVARARHVSDTCRQAGDMPNLRVGSVSARPGEVPGTELYSVTVVNAGLAPAEHVPVRLVVDGAAPDTGTIDALAPGETREIRFTGPVCERRVRGVADPDNAIHEAVERDNMLIAHCPDPATGLPVTG